MIAQLRETKASQEVGLQPTYKSKITETGNILYADVTITRNKEIPKNMTKRKLCRMANRRGVTKIGTLIENNNVNDFVIQHD